MTNLLLLAAIPLASISPQPAAPSQFDQAVRQSMAKGRPMVVLIGADWCPGCVVMKRRVIPEVVKGGGFAGVEYAYVDVDRQPRLAKQLSRAKAIPQLIRFHKTPSGWQSQLLTGAHSAKDVQRFIRNGLPRTSPAKQASASEGSTRKVSTISRLLGKAARK